MHRIIIKVGNGLILSVSCLLYSSIFTDYAISKYIPIIACIILIIKKNSVFAHYFLYFPFVSGNKISIISFATFLDFPWDGKC